MRLTAGELAEAAGGAAAAQKGADPSIKPRLKNRIVRAGQNTSMTIRDREPILLGAGRHGRFCDCFFECAWIESKARWRQRFRRRANGLVGSIRHVQFNGEAIEKIAVAEPDAILLLSIETDRINIFVVN